MSHLRFGQSEDDWRYFHNISIHNVDDSESMPWPQPVRHLAQFFNAPLPGWVATGPHPAVSDDSSNLIFEVSRQCVEDTSILLDYSCTDPVAHPLGRVFDLILSTVAILREVKSRESPGEHRITTPLWASLIRGLSRVCMPDCVSIGETRFALPRVAHPEAHPFVQLEAEEGLATLLISCVGEITPSTDREECDEQSQCVDDSMSVDADAEDKAREILQEDEDDILDPFYNAHMLEPPSDSAVMLPIICVAHPEDIIPLLASVLYQRWVWDIVEPVVGITFPKTGTIGQVIFAWLGPMGDSEVDLPIVNLSIGSCNKVCHDHGIFDLSDALSALRLSNFLSSLSEHTSKIKSATGQRGVNELDLVRKSWRADLVEKPSKGSCTRDGTIDMWRQDVADSRIPIPCSSPDAEMPPKSARKTSTKLSTDGMTGKEGSTSSIQITESGDDPQSQSGRSTKSKKSEPYSCSSYALLADEGLIDKSTMTNWLMERRALPIARTEGSKRVAQTEGSKRVAQTEGSKRVAQTEGSKRVAQTEGSKRVAQTEGSKRVAQTEGSKRIAQTEGSKQDEIIDEINAMIEIYNEYTELRWPAKWTSEDKLPPVDAGVESRRKTLFLSGNECNVPLSESVLQIIGRRLSSLLWAADGASIRHANAQNTGALEADRRHDWDSLLLRFYLTGDDDHVDVLLERMLHLARNPVHDFVHGNIEKVREDLKESILLADTYKKLCEDDQGLAYRTFEQYEELLKSEGNSADLDAKQQSASDHLTQARAAYHNAFILHSSLVDRRLEAPQGVLESLVARSIKEPHTGKCDAIGVVGIPNCFGTSRPSTKVKSFASDFCLVQHPKLESSGSAQAALSQSNPLRLKSVKSSNLQVPDPHSSSKRSQKAAAGQELTRKREPTRIFDAVEISSRFENEKQDRSESTIGDQILQLPVLLVEYKKLDPDKVDQATNQSRQYGVSAVTFLKMIGIYDFAVFGLITDGPIGAVSCTWYSQKQDCIFIMERNPRAFDIRTPIGAYHCATFLATLSTTHVQKLRAAYTKISEEFQARLGSDTERDNMMWVKKKQCDEYNLHPKSITQPSE